MTSSQYHQVKLLFLIILSYIPTLKHNATFSQKYDNEYLKITDYLNSHFHGDSRILVDYSTVSCMAAK